MRSRVYAEALAFFVLFGLLHSSACVADATWEEVAPNLWRFGVGKEQPVTLLSAGGVEPDYLQLATLQGGPFPLPKDRISMVVRDDKTYLRFPLQRKEQLYGFGLHFKTINQRGKIFQLKMDHYNGADTGRTHAPVPFYVSTKGYGVFINSAEYLTVYAGTGVRVDADDPAIPKDRNIDDSWEAQPYSDSVEVLVPADGAEIYVIGGPTSLEVVQRFNLLNGGGPLPPRWGLGFMHRTPTLYDAEAVLAEVKEFEEHDFPLDVIGLEPGWHSKAYPNTFDWDKKRFADPAGFIAEMTSRNINLNLWFNPYISPDSSIYKDMQPLSGSHTVWNGLVPDYALDKAGKLFSDHLQTIGTDIGISGFKIDEVDGFDVWLWPDTAVFPSGLTAEQQRQTYGVRLQKLITDIYKEAGRRSWGLVRASNAGGTDKPFVIYNDYYNHRDFITALVNSGFNGVLWTPEVRAADTSEEWLRRMQTAIFSPLAMLNAWSDGTKPWSFPDVADHVRDAAYLRMELIPYIYNTFAQYHYQGTPPVRPLNLVWPSEEGDGPLWRQAIAEGVRDQFLFGDDLMVAPVFAGESERQVIFPEGQWYDFYTGELAGGEEVKVIKAELKRLPVFVRDGGIIPMLNKSRHAPRAGSHKEIILRHYGQAGGSLHLYDDDGETYGYDNGEYQWHSAEVTVDQGRATGKVSSPASDRPGVYSFGKWVFMSIKAENLQ